ncbi:hypothetical protein [Legionella feeleii]|uniref:Uncharacterized protein n=1 Tax=Legionella feeleii TaxID=453 RepID=A0A378IWJ9_9GAMM|nr:hypothetical protein [Legionella feeleii]STX39300.1 Uncharacterised protein [Legionella feeleii]
MKKITIAGLALFITGIFMNTTSFAYPDRHAIEEECRTAVSQLNELISQNPDDTCMGDIKIAASYVKASALKLHYHRFEQALTDILYGQHELKDISTNRSWCRQVAKDAKPFIPIVTQIGRDIEMLSRIQEL